MTREFENAKHPEHSEGDKGPRNLKMMSIKATRMVMVPMVVKVMVLILIWAGGGGSDDGDGDGDDLDDIKEKKEEAYDYHDWPG